MKRTSKPPQKPSAMDALTVRLLAFLVLAGMLGAVYLFIVRPRALHWGAAAAELSLPLPDDDAVSHPVFDATRAITIRGRPEEVWPWLVQMGYGRAGFYGYDLIENPGSGAGIRSAQAIVPALQHPRPGDKLPISAVASLVYGPIDPNRSQVWLGAENPPRGVFIWALVPVDAAHTRLISRIRWRYRHSVSGVALGVFTEFGDSVAVPEILRGVRDRVEGRPPKPLWIEAAEMASWLMAMVELAMGVLLVFRWQRWIDAWFFALGAGLLLQCILYAPLPVWVSVLLPWWYLCVMIWRAGREVRHTGYGRR